MENKIEVGKECDRLLSGKSGSIKTR